MSSDEMDQGPKFQSSLEKQGKIAKSWKKYWFVLKEAQLTYVKSQDKMTNQGHVDMSQAQSVRGTIGNHGYPFEIVTKSRTHYLSSETAAQRDKWVKILHESMAWHSRRSSSSRSSTGSSLLRASCNSIEDDEYHGYSTVSKSPTGSPSRSSGYSTTSSRASDVISAPAGRSSYDTSDSRDSGASDVYSQSSKSGQPNVKRSSAKVGDTSKQALYEDIPDSNRQSRHEGLRRLYPARPPSGAALGNHLSIQSDASGIYDEVHEPVKIAISHIVKGYANMPRNKGPQPEMQDDEDDENDDYDDVFVNPDRSSSASSVVMRKSLHRVSDPYYASVGESPGRDSYASVGRSTMTDRESTKTLTNRTSKLPTDVDKYFDFPPVKDLPHPRIELLTQKTAFDDIRRFLANNRGPDECYASFKRNELNGKAIQSLTEYLATLVV